MKRCQVIVIVVAGILLVVTLLLPALSKARHYSGPGIPGNLITLEVAKARWLDEHPDHAEAPTKQDLLSYLTNGTPFTSFDQVIRLRNREIYSINRIGERVSAHYPHSDKLITLDSNELSLINQLK
jgi:hypothetical protein